MCANSVFLSLGSNVPDGESIISKAIEVLEKSFIVHLISDIYQTKALNGIDNDYFNCVIALKTDMDVTELKILFKDIERRFGRNEESKKRGLIELDIDIVIFNKKIIREKDYNSSYFLIGFNQIMNS